MELGNNIQKLRVKYNLSQEELAEKCGVSRQAVTKWETSDSTPAVDKIILLAEIFHVTVDELLGMEEMDTYSRLLDLVKNLAVDDIPREDTDDLSAIISRYLLFATEINLNSEDTLKGLKEIFLKTY